MSERIELNAIPRGIEVLVKKAHVDREFKATLLRLRSKAAGEIGLTLDESEAIILDVVPAGQLEAIIAAARVDPSKKAAFLGKAAAMMLVALGVSQMSAPAQDMLGLQPGPVVAPLPAPVPATQPTSQPATTSAPAASAEEVKKLVAQLDAEDFAVREKAQKTLADMGLGVVPLLEDALKDKTLSLEVFTRIQRVIRNLKATTQPAPTPPEDVTPRRGVRAVID